MASPSFNSKTIRPGSLGAYSYYRSARRPDSQPAFIAAKRSRMIPRKLAVTIVLVAALAAVPLLRGNATPSKKAASQTQAQKSSASAPPPAAAVVAAPAKTTDNCASSTLDKLVLVSISQRHLWACAGDKTVYDSPVITGMSAYASTVTPLGTYHIYGKRTDTTLTGSDITGSWSDPVSYWMPFLNNQYGTYGLHDATWRSNSAFGNISPDSSDASHGCVELPLATAAWLYNWTSIGTAVTIEA